MNYFYVQLTHFILIILMRIQVFIDFNSSTHRAEIKRELLFLDTTNTWVEVVCYKPTRFY